MLTLSDKPSTSYRSHLRDPKTVLEYPKPLLSRLSDVIKWQAPLIHRQADGQTNMPCLHSLPSARPWQAVLWCSIVRFGLHIHLTNQLAEEQWNVKIIERISLAVNLKLISAPEGEKKNQHKNKHQLELTVSLLFFSQDSMKLGCKDSGAPGFGPDRPQRG